jgi:glycosyltransferase A (GT-A) superfamily protein (DUF2064 family)
MLGRIKTRLAASIGDTDALAVYRALLHHTATVAAEWGPVLVHRTGDPAAYADWPLSAFPHCEQAPGNLGTRLEQGLLAGLESGPALAIGTDCPGLSIAALARCAALVAEHEAVFGPSTDGGYWCLGVSHANAVRVCCGEDLPWSQPALMRETEARCTAAGIATQRGPVLADCDDITDLRAAEAAGFSW